MTTSATPPWWCPVCHALLRRPVDEGRLCCQQGHSFDIARQGYVNLLQARRRAGGDSPDMVAARRAFLATGAYQPISDRITQESLRVLAIIGHPAPVVVDVGCGEGYYTRGLAGAIDAGGDPERSGCPATADGRATAGVGSGNGESVAGVALDGVRVAGVDIARSAVAAAAARHRRGFYAVASAFDLPMAPGSVQLVLSVFGPAATDEFARVLDQGGAIVAVHPGPRHLERLRHLVYDEAAPHAVKDPLRGAPEAFVRTAMATVTYPLCIDSPEVAGQLFDMTPYRWHARRDIYERFARNGGLDTEVDVVISIYQRTSRLSSPDPENDP